MSEQLYVKFTPATESASATIHGHNGYFCSTAITLKQSCAAHQHVRL